MKVTTKTIKLSDLIGNNGQLKGLPKNPRIIKDNRFKALKQSIKDSPEFLKLRELLVYPFEDKFIVIAGNQRLAACKDLKIKEVHCKVLPIETPIEKLKEYTIKDNVSFGEMDWEIIKDDWANDDLGAWGEEVPEWGEEIKSKELADAKDDNFEIPERAEEVTKPGDIIQIGKHRLICADSTTLETYVSLFGNDMADIVVTDPPYNVDYEGKTKDKLKIQNDKKEDSDFYNFLFNFYSNLNKYVKPGGHGTYGTRIVRGLISEQQCSRVVFY